MPKKKMDFDKIEELLTMHTEDCLQEICDDYSESELNSWDEAKSIEYLIEYLGFELNKIKATSKK